MSSPQELLYICCLGLSISLGQFDDAIMSPPVVTQEKESSCSCGGFPTASPELNVPPILSQSPGLVVRCDDDGGFTCKSLCLALATAAKAKGPEILCNRLKNAEELKLSAFYKLCDRPWTYANMTADEPLCCEDSKVKPCPSAESGSTQTPASIEIKTN